METSTLSSTDISTSLKLGPIPASAKRRVVKKLPKVVDIDTGVIPRFEEIGTSIEVYVATLNGTIKIENALWLVGDDPRFAVDHKYLRLGSGPMSQKVVQKDPFDYCINLKYPGCDGSKISVKVYRDKIQISGLKNVDSVNQIDSIFPMFERAQHFFDRIKSGDLGDEVQQYLSKINWTNQDHQLKIDWIMGLESIIVKPADSKLVIDRVYTSMSNCVYSLNRTIKIFDLAQSIKNYPGFEKAKVIYNNLLSPHKVIIFVAADLSGDLPNKIWKKKEANVSFTVYSTGRVTQSGPHRECNHKPFYLFWEAVQAITNLK